MGFTTGLTGGVTLTLGLAYLTVVTHERNRQAQSASLRSQSRVLQSLVSPAPLIAPPQSRYELAREEHSSLIETAKDRWNDEVESAVRWIQRTDWEDVRVGLEGAVSRLRSSGSQKSQEGIETAENAAAPRVQEAIDVTKAKAEEARHKAAVGVDRAASSAIAGVERAGASVKEGGSKIAALAREKASAAKSEGRRELQHAEEKAAALRDAAEAKTARASADTKSTIHNASDAVKHSGGTIDAARGAVRDVISKGIEKGKEVVGKAQEAVGLATERVEHRFKTEVSPVSAQEAALARRYAPVQIDTRTPEQVLADRYRPIDSNPTNDPVLPVV